VLEPRVRVPELCLEDEPARVRRAARVHGRRVLRAHRASAPHGETERGRQVRTSHEYVGCDCAHALVFGNVFGTLSRP
jgi:hypothetical protein